MKSWLDEIERQNAVHFGMILSMPELLDKCTLENMDLKKENQELKDEVKELNDLVIFLRKCSNKHKTDENIEIYRNNELIKENIRLRNKLVIDGIKSKERERYLRAYQDLYVREVERNRDKED